MTSRQAESVGAALYARVSRWHFYAGLFVAPLGLMLAATGSLYLFKPQIEAAIERGIHAGVAPSGPPLPTDRLVAAALSAEGPGALLEKLVLPRSEADPSVEVQVQSAALEGSRVLWIERSSGRVLARRDPEREWLQIAKRLHGQLLAGQAGSLIVELAACWMILLIASGLYLAWPRAGVARALFPRLRLGTRSGWRDLHAATGLWAGAVVLLFLLSGLPWTTVWGGGFDRLTALAGMSGPGQEFRVTLQSSPPPGSAADGLHPWHSDAGGEVTLQSGPAAGRAPISLQSIVERASAERLAAPVEVSPPRGADGVWTVRSMTQRRPDRVTLHYDRWTGDELLRIGFDDHPAIQRAVSYGIALHEGQLFGPLNQAFGLGIALAVTLLCASGTLAWWRRRPRRALGVPPAPSERRLVRGVTLLVVGLGILLPLAGLSLIAVAALDALTRRALRASPSLGRRAI